MSIELARTVEGLLAVNKPTGISSAQVLRELQKHFKTSALFQPWLEHNKKALEEEANRLPHSQSKQRRRLLERARQKEVKIGHGGTLDPLATGVLITGIGSATKQLSKFLGCTKSYETTMVFGASTDTYDRVGKILGTASSKDITQSGVEKALEKFRGTFLQSPPVYSALRIQGKKLYEYMREGIEIPEQVKPREMTVHQLEIVKWWNQGEHDFGWPEEVADDEVRGEAQALDGKIEEAKHLKRKRDEGEESEQAPAEKQRRVSVSNGDDPVRIEKKEGTSDEEAASAAPKTPTPEAASGTAESPKSPTSSNYKGPAVRLKMTVTSGFYVRSLCHDLGKDLGSMGYMAELIRTRQGGYEVGENVLNFEDLDLGEEVWAPKVKHLLSEKEQKLPSD